MIQTLSGKLFTENRITLSALRLDMVHAEVSGNKWYKLKYHIADALAHGKSGIVSFGGAYSNHLVALAYACRENRLSATAFIRGDEDMSNPSIGQMTDYGMKLLFVSREVYRDKQELADEYLSAHPHQYYVPEGGQSKLGIKGAAEILQAGCDRYTHIACAVGTGTTIAGIVNGSSLAQTILGVSALRVSNRNENELLHFIEANTDKSNWQLFFDYHFGGYAKKNEKLIRFMNGLYRSENIPTDFVYTAKLFYAVHDLAHKNFFPEGSNVLIVHSGGLQGNRSLPQGLLDF